ncbi:hypothetical protein SKAU_G00318740 [Synaphobranchus kaupii]|uniref:Uncharacterized protein n=1 Tax=Synaphobranchus kaupii TaxID=118154 RepID=A0A9Q1IM35_SYNKA|nr:hypothetical protein SKAU_G00318740 [Synaphobranchus kaupii]
MGLEDGGRPVKPMRLLQYVLLKPKVAGTWGDAAAAIVTVLKLIGAPGTEQTIWLVCSICGETPPPPRDRKLRGHRFPVTSPVTHAAMRTRPPVQKRCCPSPLSTPTLTSGCEACVIG